MAVYTQGISHSFFEDIAKPRKRRVYGVFLAEKEGFEQKSLRSNPVSARFITFVRTNVRTRDQMSLIIEPK